MVGRGGIAIRGEATVTIIRPTLPHGLLLQAAALVLGETTHEGRLIEAVTPAWVGLAKLIAENPAAMFQIDPRKLEEMMAGWYEQQGYTVTLTPRSGDFGRDVIAERPGVLSLRIIDQVKAYAPGHRVLANDVRALLGVLQADGTANKGLVTTTSEFAPGITTDPYISQFLPTRLELVDGVELRKRLAQPPTEGE
jgi:restriction system protein